jgi:hypothetical protein
MAIATLIEQGQFDLYEDPWPKAALRLVPEPLGGGEFARAVRPEPGPMPRPLRASSQVQTRPRERNRRRSLLTGAVAVMAVVALAAPLKALGGVTVTGQQTPGGLPNGLIPGQPYTVHGGDTIASIAARLGGPSAQVHLQNQIRSEVGSSILVPGERITLP